MACCTIGVLILTHAYWLTEVAGLPLLHRVLLSGRKAGVQRWLVLCCGQAAAVQQSLDAAARLRDVAWHVYDLQAMAPSQLVALLPSDDLLVVLTPAAFDYRLLMALQEATGPTLGVAPAEAPVRELCSIHHGVVVRETGTAPPAWRSAGLLRCSGAVLAALLQQCWPDVGRVVLSATLLSATETPWQALDVSPYVWVPLAEPLPVSVMAAETRLLRSLGREGDSLFVRLVDRRISQAITRRLMHTAVRPNQITLCSALIGISGALCLAQPGYLWPVVGSLLFLLSTVVDGCDGEIARLTFQESAFGARLDVVMDNVVHLFLFPSIALGLYRRAYESIYLWLGGLTILGVAVSMLVFLPYLWRRQTARSTLARVHEHLASRDFAYALPVLALFDKLHWFLWATTIGTYLFAVAWVLIVARVQRQQRRVSGAPPASAA
ncbi:MAG: CDP-alcohol phosphatidyltransferase family protein [Candidatus Tectimicrobiota bacterium]